MNGKDLLEGLSDIDETYVEEAETETVRNTKPMTWLRWAAPAACACLIAAVVLWHPMGAQTIGDMAPGGTWPEIGLLTENEEYPDGAPNGIGSGEMVVPTEPADYLFYAHYIRVGEQNGEAEYPTTELITSRAELEQYCTGLEEYDDSYFTDNNLLLITLEEPSGSIRHRVVGFRRDPETAEWTVTVERNVPAECTDDMALWQILISVQMGAAVREGDEIYVQFVTQVEEG